MDIGQAENFFPTCPVSATIIPDTACFSDTFGAMLLQYAASGRILHQKFICDETNKDYLNSFRCIEEDGTRINATLYDCRP